jgi:tetratricopeptide (TPR) repeat protein
VTQAAPAPVEWLFLDHETPPESLAAWLADVLPHCAWSCHVVVAGHDPGAGLLRTIIDHLRREPLVVAHLHQVFDGAWLESAESLDRMMTAASGFQGHAYRERCGSRLVALPILKAPGLDVERQIESARDLAEHLAKPSLLLREPPPETVAADAAALGLRLYLGGPGAVNDLEILTAGHVIDSTIDRMAEGRPVLGPCRPHLVVARGRVHACARQWALGVSLATHEARAPIEWTPDIRLCSGCVADAVAGSTATMAANLRRGDGRTLALRVGAALAEAGDTGPAAVLAKVAAELSDSNLQRAEAHIQEGLCRLAEGQLAAAEAAFIGAAGLGAEPGDVAYHRAKVQVAWRDDIEALDRYAEALELGTELVADTDLHLEMALSHVRLEEWAEAREHLCLAGDPSTAIEFNLGVCDLNEGRAMEALSHFDGALSLSPPLEDLGRIRFFRGYCLKELARFDEAVIDLERAIRLETAELAHHNLLGFCLFKLGRHAEAATCFTRAVELDPSSAIDWANLGVNLERLGNIDRAAAMYRRALSLDQGIEFAIAGLERIAPVT